MKARLLLAALLLVGACADDEPSATESTTTSSGPPSSAPSATTAPPSGTTRLRLEPVAEFENPVNMTHFGDVLYVVEQGGRIRALRGGAVESQPVLDVSDEVRAGGEQGLLGLAFSNDGRHLYVNFTDTRGDTRIVEYAFDGTRADESTRRELLKVDQPFANHNGGHIVIDSEGVLWIGMGDGGSAGDPQNNAQNARALLGKLLKLDPRDPDPQPQIWALGLRNPWRFHLDQAANTLWVADVGQNAVEEINRVPLDRAGVNYGWRLREGSQPFRGGEKPPGAVDPVHEYTHDDDGGCSITGGGVYRGDALPALRGAYLFGDYCLGEVHALMPDGQDIDTGAQVEALTSFGTDGEGEMYVLSAGDGGMYRLVPA